MGVVVIRLGYKYRLYPTKTQKEFLEQHFGACRFVYNHFWNKYKDSKLPSKTKLQTELKELKNQKEYNWLYSINSQSLQVAIHNLLKAYKKAFDKNITAERKKAIAKAKTPKQRVKALKYGFPNFKKKKSNYQSFTVPQNVKLAGNKLYIPKLKSGIKVRLHRELQGTIKQAIISKKNGKYYVSFSVEKEIIIPKRFFNPVGIDVGLTHFCTMSTGEKIPNPHWIEKTEKRKAILQRRLSRKQKFSNNWYKLNLKISKLEEKISNQRKDFLHKLSTAIAKRFSVIVVESLNVKGMLKNHYLAKAISDAGWSTFISFLRYKSVLYGAKLIQASPFYPSSKLCSVCGYKNDNLTLSNRYWTCPVCGTKHDRDINAARNLLKAGLERPEEPVEASPLGEPMKQEAPAYA